MRNFAYLRPNSLDEAVASAAAGAVFIAGGTELLNWMRLGIADPDAVADIGRLGGLRGIALDGEVVRIGALNTLNEIGTSEVVRRAMPVLSQACLAAASAQLRNLATIGGNVLQKTRCPYFRAEAAGAKGMPWPCNKRVAGSGCAARESGYARLALFGGSEACVATHPSDPAVALAVLDAIVEISSPDGARTMPIGDFLLTQEEAAAQGGTRATNAAALENRLQVGEIITGFRVPADAAARRSAYVKVRERQSYEYAMVSAAVAIDLDGERIRSARVALGSVAQKPWRLASAERALAGIPLRSERVGQALEAALADARPPKGNEFKVRSRSKRGAPCAAGGGRCRMIQAPRRPDGRAKVTGDAAYAGERSPSNVLHAVMVTSPIARGRVTRIDASAALEHPGVMSVLTHADMPRLAAAPVPPAAQSFTPMQSTEVQYEGQPVALVLAETLEAAEHGAALVDAQYASAAPVAFEHGEVVIPRKEGNGYAFAELDVRKGDADTALANAAAKVDAEYVTPTRHHNMMEPSATLAEWRGDELHVHDATQWTFGIRYALAALLQMPPAKIHVRCPYTGGGFGAKGYVWPHQILAPLAARIAGRPVKLCIDRVGCYTGCGYQPVVRSRVRLGADRAGKLTAVVHETTNVTSRFDDYVEYGSAGTRGLYAMPAFAASTRIVKADVGTPTALRAPHEGPGMFALESAVDELAYALGLDPLELRLRNHAETDPLSGKPFSSKKLREVYEEGARRFGWAKRPSAPRSMTDRGKLIGWGMASAIMSTFRFASTARVRLAANGDITIEAGCQEIGTGPYTIMPQLAGEVLGVPPERIKLRLGDTGLPETGGTFGSSTTMSTGSAVIDAARKLKDRLAAILGAEPRLLRRRGPHCCANEASTR